MAQAEPKQPSKLPKIAAAFGVFILLLIVGRLISNYQPRPSANTRGASDAAAMFAEAKTLIRQGKWAAAKEKLEAVREEDEDYESRQIANYLKVAEQELPNEAHFAAVNEAIAKGELGRASSELAQVKTSMQDKAISDAKEALARAIESKRTEARTLLEPPASVAKWESLLAISDDLLVAVPKDREASEWKQQAEQAIAKSKKGGVKVVAAETPWLEARQRFKNGDTSGALSLAHGCAKKHAECRAMEAGISVLEAKTKNLESLSDGDLLTLFKLDKELAGGVSSDTSKPLRTRLATRFALKASSAKTTQNWAKAIEYARQALEAEPGHAAAQAIITEGKQISGDLYVRAYQLRDTDQGEALKLFKEVYAMTPADDENHTKAKGYIDRFEGR
jgi:tetratricopeptide (TPR) repeat protein